MNTAPVTHRIIQLIPTIVPYFASREERSAMKRTMMWGWPK